LNQEDDFLSAEKLKVACFICNWAFSEEKLAIRRARKLGEVNVMRVACVGGVDPALIFETFMNGADGVLLVGCSPSDCHFVDGSLYAESTVAVARKLLALACLGSDRLALHLSSPAEESKFSTVMDDFAKLIEKLGHSALTKKKPDANIVENITAAKNAVEGFRLRAYLGKELELTRRANTYGERISQDEFNAFLDEVVAAEFIRQKILLMAKKEPFSVKELAKVLNMKPPVVFRHVLNMRRKGMITLERTEGTTPLYKAAEVH
jgi:coenzyme F420-reducing hydrogenase delta subunit